MKKIFVSIGLAATAAGLSSAFAQGMESAAPKLWNVSGTLRGFYDDNYNVSNDKKGSAGIEVSPSISANLDLQQTDLGMRYTFGMYDYFDRDNDGSDPIDYTHQADVWLDHAFDETFKVNVTDTFIVAQDPKLVDGGAVTRVGGNNVVNHARINFTKDWTRQFSTATYYGNNLVMYDDTHAKSPASGPGGIGPLNSVNQGYYPSQAAILNRIEQNVGMDFQWQFEKETMGFVGYNFAWTRYTGSAYIQPYNSDDPPQYSYRSESRNNNIHYGYVGVQHEFSPNLSATARGGISYIDMYNDPVSASHSLAPYADISATYTFTPGSYLQGGFTQNINATDVVAPGADHHLTQYQESSVAYMNLTHKFDSKLTGSLVGQYEYSQYKDGAYGDEGDNMVSAGVSLNYQINSHFSANAGYNYDELFSDIAGREYSRNRVYIGLGANY